MESKLLLEIDVFSRCGTDPVAAFLHRLTEKHETDETEILVDAGDYLTVLARQDLSGRLITVDEILSKNGLRRSQCGSTAFTRSGGAVQPAFAAG